MLEYTPEISEYASEAQNKYLKLQNKHLKFQVHFPKFWCIVSNFRCIVWKFSCMIWISDSLPEVSDAYSEVQTHDLKFQMQNSKLHIHSLNFSVHSGAHYVVVQTQYLQQMQGLNVTCVIWNSHVKYDPKYTFYILHLKSEFSSSCGLEVLNFRSKRHPLCCISMSMYTLGIE